MSCETVHLIRVYKVLRRIQQPQPVTPGKPLLFPKSALGSFTGVTKHIGANGITSNPKDEPMVIISVLLILSRLGNVS